MKTVVTEWAAFTPCDSGAFSSPRRSPRALRPARQPLTYSPSMDSPLLGVSLRRTRHCVAFCVLLLTIKGSGNSLASMLVRTPLVTSGRDHNSNHLKLNASVDEEWHLLVRVVKKDAGNCQPQLHPGSRCQQDPGWLPCPPLDSAGLAPPSAGFPGGRAVAGSASSSPCRDRVSSSAVTVPEPRLAGLSWLRAQSGAWHRG